MQSQPQYRIYQGPHSMKTPHLPIQTGQSHYTKGHIDGGIVAQEIAQKQRNEGGGSLSPSSPTQSSPPVITRSAPHLPNIQLVHNSISPVLLNNSPPLPNYPVNQHPEAALSPPPPQHAPPPPPQQMSQLNLVWQGLPENAQIDPDQMFILSGNSILRT